MNKAKKSFKASKKLRAMNRVAFGPSAAPEKLHGITSENLGDGTEIVREAEIDTAPFDNHPATDEVPASKIKLPKYRTMKIGELQVTFFKQGEVDRIRLRSPGGFEKGVQFTVDEALAAADALRAMVVKFQQT